MLLFKHVQGELLGLRLEPEDEQDDSEHHQGMFKFDDGGMRALACAVCWCGLIHHCRTLPLEQLTDPGVAALARSLLQIPSFFRSGPSDPCQAMIKRIIKQNVDAKKLAVSSYEWFRILSRLVQDGEKVSAQDAIAIYNNTPEVSAHGGGSSKDIDSLGK